MQYHSTRGKDRNRSFSEVLLAGLAADGGLFLPEKWPQFSDEIISSFAGRSYPDVAAEIAQSFIGDEIPKDLLRSICERAYARFDHVDVAPLVKIGPEHWLLELFHGPTLAFKDVAMQLLGQLLDHALQQADDRLTIVGATSGDTGGAAIEALKGVPGLDLVILHPHNKTSEVQRRMMTAVVEDNIHNIAVQGSFDDCQRLVKQMFADESFRKRINMGAVNSINWARIMAQTVYYFTSAAALGKPLHEISYVVPTGNFGDIFAGFVASRMGLPVDVLCIATNQNDILRRALETGVYKPQTVHETTSPSMDIQISSNFERLLFEASNRNAGTVSKMMSDLEREGQFEIPEQVLSYINSQFAAYSSSEAEAGAMIRRINETENYLIDPHTAIGLVAAKKALHNGRIRGPVVTLSTAHPAKFPAAMKQAVGIDPALPRRFSDLYERAEKYAVLPNDLAIVQDHILTAI